MSKIMSMFEKLNLVEKVDDKAYKPSSISNNNLEKEATEEETIELETHTDKPDSSIPESVEEDGQSTNDYGINKNMSIADIYTNFGIKEGSINTIFMLEKFINALPENLPLDIKRQSVINILEASDTNLNMLISDGEKRLNILNTFAKDYFNSTTEKIEQYKSEIAKLNDLINNYKEQIKLKESMLLEQNNVIKYETEKINSTINFFRNND